MLPKTNRLPAFEFVRLKQEGVIVHGPFASALVYKRGSHNIPRFGIIVSSKISKSAVVRNRVKRAIRKAVIESLDSIGGYDVLILAKPKLIDLGSDAVAESFSSLFRRAHLYKEVN